MVKACADAGEGVLSTPAFAAFTKLPAWTNGEATHLSRAQPLALGCCRPWSGGPIGFMIGYVVSQNIFQSNAAGSTTAYWVFGGSANVSDNDYHTGFRRDVRQPTIRQFGRRRLRPERCINRDIRKVIMGEVQPREPPGNQYFVRSVNKISKLAGDAG